VSVCINVSTQPSGALVTIHGLLDARLVETGAGGLAAVARGCGGLDVDLWGTVLASPTELSHLVRALDLQAADQPISLVCDGLLGRRRLARCCRGAVIRVLDELPRYAGTSWTARSC
jgi:hypothetical protein